MANFKMVQKATLAHFSQGIQPYHARVLKMHFSIFLTKFANLTLFSLYHQAKQHKQKQKDKATAGVPILLRSIMGRVVNITTTSN